MRIHCLGGGLVGLYVTDRLVEYGYDVHLFDVVERVTKAKFWKTDCLDHDHSDADIIVNMVPGSIGARVIHELKNTGVRIVDLSFSEQTPDTQSESQSTILWDVGIAPGLSNMLVAMASRKFGILDEVTIKVGGNPSKPDGNWSYMAPFSPHDVIAEYTRPARIIRDGELVIVPAITDLHTIDANGRKMEAFLTDGLRSLLDVPAKNMGEYTVRWPGHIDKYQHSDLDPDDLVEEWRFDISKGEFTWMEVKVRSGKNNIKWVVEDSGHGLDSSMARTTGLVTACCVIAWAENENLLSKGIHAPESLDDDTIQYVIDVMREQGVVIEKTEFEE